MKEVVLGTLKGELHYVLLLLSPVSKLKYKITEGPGQVSYDRCCDQHGAQPAAGWGSGSHVALNSLAFGHFRPHSPLLKIKEDVFCPLRNFLDFLPV